MGRKKASIYTGKIEKVASSDYFALAALIFAAAVVPLIVYLKIIELEGVIKQAWTGVETHADFFSYWKSQFLVICLICLILYWLYRVISRSVMYINRIFIPIALYILLMLLSSVFSEYRDVAFSGFVDRYEGAFAILAYMALLITSATVIRTENQAVKVMISIFISCAVIAILGLTQFYGIDFLQTPFGKRLMLPKEYENIADTLKFTFAGQRIMYTTLYNPNYLGSYSALLLPIALGFFYGWAESSRWKAILGALFVSASFVLFLGGMSRAGLLGGGLALLVFIILFRKRIIKLWPYTISILILLSGLYVAMDTTSGGVITREVLNTLPSSFAPQIGSPDQNGENKTNNEPNSEVSPRSKYVKDISINGNKLLFRTETEQLTITNNKGILSFTDSDNKELSVKVEENSYVFEDSRYSLYKIVTGEEMFQLIWNDINIPVIVSENKLSILVKQNYAITKLDKPETFGFKGKERFASSRGYIWSRSIPMLKNTIIIGNGPDTFAIHFPQNEIDAKINFLSNTSVIVDKPHSWYLQMGIDTGVISLIAMMVFLAWYWLKGFFIWLKDVTGMEKIIGAAILCGVTGYCVAAVFNDSAVSVAPVFWVLLGIGISFVYKYAPAK